MSVFSWTWYNPEKLHGQEAYFMEGTFEKIKVLLKDLPAVMEIMKADSVNDVVNYSQDSREAYMDVFARVFVYHVLGVTYVRNSNYLEFVEKIRREVPGNFLGGHQNSIRDEELKKNTLITVSTSEDADVFSVQEYLSLAVHRTARLVKHKVYSCDDEDYRDDEN